MDDVATGDLVEPAEWMPRTRKSAIRHANAVMLAVHTDAAVFWIECTKTQAYDLLDQDNEEGSGMECFAVRCGVPDDVPRGFYVAWLVLYSDEGPVHGYTGRLFAEDKP